jgi:hypothetical protein
VNPFTEVPAGSLSDQEELMVLYHGSWMRRKSD